MSSASGFSWVHPLFCEPAGCSFAWNRLDWDGRDEWDLRPAAMSLTCQQAGPAYLLVAVVEVQEKRTPILQVLSNLLLESHLLTFH